MDIHEFYKLRDRVPTFRLNRDLHVTSYVWVVGSDPHAKAKRIRIHRGTILVKNSYSNFGDGHSMSFADPIATMKGRWFRVPYSAMDHAGWRVE